MDWEIALGAGNTPYWHENLTLQAEIVREDALASLETTTVEDDTLKLEGTFTFEAEASVSEIGIFKKAPDSFLLCRIVIDTVGVPPSESFPVTVLIPIGD